VAWFSVRLFGSRRSSRQAWNGPFSAFVAVITGKIGDILHHFPQQFVGQAGSNSRLGMPTAPGHPCVSGYMDSAEVAAAGGRVMFLHPVPCASSHANFIILFLRSPIGPCLDGERRHSSARD